MNENKIYETRAGPTLIEEADIIPRRQLFSQ